MPGLDVTRLTAMEIARLVAAREISPVEVTEAYLERSERLDPELHAYITLCCDEALQAAREAERAVLRGERLGPLHGVPVAVKDQFQTRGLRTTGGSRILADWVPMEDATAVARLRQAGAILLGKLNMTEFASGLGDPFRYGDPHNPWDLERSAGDSSTGSAVAVAAALCAASLGEDTGGSARFPASLTGIVGLRPTYRRVSRYGLLPVCWSMDTAGPMTRTVADAALLLQVIAGHDAQDPLSSRRPVPDYLKALKNERAGLRIGIVRELTAPGAVHPEVLQAVRQAARHLASLGAVVEEVSLPLLEEAGAAMAALMGSDAAFVYREWLQSRPHDLGPTLRRGWIAASLLPGPTLHKAARIRALLRREWLALLQRYDVLLSPTTLAPAGKLEYASCLQSREEAERLFAWRLGPTMETGIAAIPASFAGTPAISVPCGFSAEGLPIGLQIMAGPFQEETLFQVAAAYERTTPWHTVSISART